MDHCNTVCSLDLAQCKANRGDEVTAKPFHFLDEVDEDFSVGFGYKEVSRALQLCAYGEIVFDDAIMDEGNFVFAVSVGMSVDVARRTVCRPASVADPCSSIRITGRK